MTKMLDSVHAAADDIRITDWLLWTAAVVPYAIGWAAGFIVRLILWLVAAVIAGYRAGRGG